MADQATLKQLIGGNANGSMAHQQAPGADDPDPGAGGMVSNVAGFGENLLTLAELQARLTAVELRQNITGVKTAGALLSCGSVLGLTALPILVVSFAELLVSEVGMKRGYALLTVATTTMAIAGCCIAIAVRWLKRGATGFPLSVEEFARNLNWLRTIIKHSGRRPLSR